MGGDTGKEGIGYEEKVLAFLLCSPYEVTASEALNFTKAQRWEINPKLFNKESLGTDFTADVDFYIKIGSVYHIFFIKSSRKLEKRSSKEYFETALGTFCVFESQGRIKFQENFKYYYFADSIPYHLVNELPARDNFELSRTLLKVMGCDNTNENQKIFSPTVVANVKQKTRFCQVDESLIKERRDRFPEKFDKLITEIALAKRDVEESINGISSESPYQVLLGTSDLHDTVKITHSNVAITISKISSILQSLHDFANSKEVITNITPFSIDDLKFKGLSESKSVEVVISVFNDIILPNADVDIAIFITLNDYNFILFKPKDLSELIWETLDRKSNKYDLSKVKLLSIFDKQTALAIAILSFSKGRSVDLPINKFIFSKTHGR